jgi:hypothetical protein
MGLPVVVALSVAGLLAGLGGAVVLSTGTGCVSGSTDVVVTDSITVEGFTTDELTNAAAIMNVATRAGLDARAQTVGLVAAIAESHLRNLDHAADGGAATSLGVFQLPELWGADAVRLDPAQSAELFYGALAKIPEWTSKSPTVAAQLTMGPTELDSFSAALEPALRILDALNAGVSSACVIGGDGQSLAADLVTHIDDGTLTSISPAPLAQIRGVADGTATPDCGIDVRVLQMITLAIRTFHQVGVSSINRLCTGQLLGAGSASSHNIDGGGHAVDFYSLGGRALTGADGQSLRLISLLDPAVPSNARIGQSGCRADADVHLALEHFTEFADTCDHLHVDVAFTRDPLAFG